MQMPVEQQPPDSAAAEGKSNHLIRLIRKLRWVGMDEKAERVLKELKHGQSASADSVLACPRDTD